MVEALHPSSRRTVGGFTLIEAMLVVTLIGVLAMIGYPAYTDHIQKSRRAEAITLINRIAQEQERWRANNPAYTTLLSASGVNVADPSSGYYAASVPAAAASSYTVVAVASGAQAGDAKCSQLIMRMIGGNIQYDSVGTAASAVCWSRR